MRYAVAISLYVIMYTLIPVRVFGKADDYNTLASKLTEQSLPLVNLEVNTGSISKEKYTDGTIELTDFHQRTEKGQRKVRYRCRVKYRGATSMRYEKKSFGIKIIDKEGKKINVSIMGIATDDTWMLDAMAIDRIRMRNRVCFDLWNKISHTPYNTKHGSRNGIQGVFVELFLNGEYHGLYCLEDKVTRRLLSLEKIEQSNGKATPHGLMYKCVGNGRGHALNDYNAKASMTRFEWNNWELKYPDEDDIASPNATFWKPLQNVMDFCGRKTPKETFSKQVDRWFYVDNVILYSVFTNALGIWDNAWKNTFLSTPDIQKSHRFLITPWDMDASMGGTWSGEHAPGRTSIHRYDTIAPYNRLRSLDVDGYRMRLVACWDTLRDKNLSYDSVTAQIDCYATAFTESGAWQRECSKWNGKPVPLTEDINEELDYVKEWYQRNHDYLLDALLADVKTPIEDIYPEADTTNIPPTAEIPLYDVSGKKIPTHHPGRIIVVTHHRKYLYRK